MNIDIAHSRTKTPFSTLLGRVNEMKPAFMEMARDTEKHRRVSAKTMAMLKEAEIHKVLMPAAYGGFEYGFKEALTLGFEIGRACGSTAWCASLTMSYPWMASNFSKAAQDEIWQSPDTIFCSANPDPKNQLDVTDDGIVCSGIWYYGSNCENSQWMMLSQHMPLEDGSIDRVSTLIPTSAARIDHDSWQTSGLQGTGSKTIYLDKPVFVPRHMMTSFHGGKFGAPGRDIEGNIMSRFPFPTFGTSMLAAPILGMAQGALDIFINHSKKKIRMIKPGMTEPVSNSPIIQSKIGIASASIDAALALLISSSDAAEQVLRRGEELSVGEKITLRRNQGFAARQAVSVVNDLFAMEGSSASSLAAPMQRFWRDVNTGAQHITLNWDSISTMYGQQVFGLTPIGNY